MEMNFDWLTLTIKPEHELASPEENSESFHKIMGILRHRFILGDLIDKMECKGHCRFYDLRFAYNDINLKVPVPEQTSHQGFCLEMSSAGLQYFRAFLSSYGLTLKQWLGMFRAYGARGYITKVPRVDIALDDKVYDGARPTLTMRKVLDSIYDGELSCKSRIISDDCSDMVSFKNNYHRHGGMGFFGSTVQLGSRGVDTFVRFYDKLIEQQRRHNELPENLTSWVRCEYEFRNENAMSIINYYLDCDRAQFSEHVCAYILDHCKFINRTCTNVSRCPVKRWWKEFLNGCKKAVPLPHIKPARSAVAKLFRWIPKQVSFSLITLKLMVGSLDDYVDCLADEYIANGIDPIKYDVLNSYKDNKRFYEELNGFKHWDYNSDLPSSDLRSNILRHELDFCGQTRKVSRKPSEFGSQVRLVYDE